VSARLSLEATFGAFGRPGFPGLWVSAAAGSFGRVATQVVLSWVVLELSGSPFLVGAVLAARMAPQLLLGIPAGLLADWFERRRLVIVANLASTTAALVVAWVAAAGWLSVPLALATAAAFGTLDTLRTTVTQTYAYDLVRAARATSGLALTNLGVQLFGALGGLIAGYAQEQHGAAASFGLVALAALLAALAPALTPGPRLTSEPVGRTVPDLWRVLSLLLHNRLLATIALGIIVAEILGYSSLTLLPTFAHDVFGVDAGGFGALMFARAAGGVVSLLLLARFGTGERSGQAFLGACVVFGLMLIAFAASNGFGLGLVLLALAGAAAAICDTLGQMLLQRYAEDRARGTAMGLWVFSIGFAPFGHLGLGAVASVLGAPLAQALSGLTLVLVTLVVGLATPLRRAR
jgi:MFS family permease